jgi:hypothetical protein
MLATISHAEATASCDCGTLRDELAAIKFSLRDFEWLQNEVNELRALVRGPVKISSRPNTKGAPDPALFSRVQRRAGSSQNASEAFGVGKDGTAAFLVAGSGTLDIALGTRSAVGFRLDSAGALFGSNDGTVAGDITAGGTVSVGILRTRADFSPAGTGEFGGRNYLTNGGAESGLAAWISESYDENCGGIAAGSGASASAASFSGSNAFAVHNCGMATQTVDLAPGATYVLSARTRTANVCHTGDAAVGYLVAFGTDGSELGTQACHANHFDSSPDCSKFMLCWLRFQAHDTVDTPRVSVKIALKAAGHTHSFLFDEVMLSAGAVVSAFAPSFSATGPVTLLDQEDQLILGADFSPAGLGEFGGMNHLINGGAESAMSGWDSGSVNVDLNCGGNAAGSSAGTSTSVFSGTYSFAAYNCGMASQMVNLAPGAMYVLSARTRVNHACHTGDASAGRLVVYDPSDSVVGSQDCHPNNFDSTPNCNKWVLCWLRFHAPDTADTAQSSVKITLQSWGYTHSLLFDEVMLGKGSHVSACELLSTTNNKYS